MNNGSKFDGLTLKQGMKKRVIVLGAVLSGAGTVLALVYRSSSLKQRIRSLLGFGNDDRYPVLDSRDNDTPSQALTTKGYVGARKDTVFISMDEVTVPSDLAELKLTHSRCAFE